MKAWWLVLLSGCAASLTVNRTVPSALRNDTVIAIAASGPYAMELVAGVRSKLAPRVKVESCLLGCPAVGLYASLSLTPGPQDGRIDRTCQAEVYTGESWLTPKSKRGVLTVPVRELEPCVTAITKLLVEPSKETLRLRLDVTGPLAHAGELINTGKLEEARMELEALTASMSEPTGAWYDLGVLHESRGELDEARRCYAEASKRSPTPWMKIALELN